MANELAVAPEQWHDTQRGRREGSDLAETLGENVAVIDQVGDVGKAVAVQVEQRVRLHQCKQFGWRVRPARVAHDTTREIGKSAQ